MKPKNVMLLGFVNKAVEYLDAHLDDKSDPRLSELRNIDLKALKDELHANIGSSLGAMHSTVDTLLQAGEDAFDDFIGDDPAARVSDRKDLSDQLNEIFDSGLFDLTGKQETSKDSLDDLLSYYHLDQIADAVSDNDAPSEALLNEVLQENVAQNADAAAERTVADEKVQETEDAEEDDLAAEKRREEALLELLREQEAPAEAEPVFEMSKEDADLFDQIAQNVNASADVADKDSDLDQELDSIFNEVLENEPAVEQPEPEKDPLENDSAQIDKNDIIAMVKDIQESTEKHFGELPPADEYITTFTRKDEKKEEKEVYVNSLIDELKEKMYAEDEKKRVREEEYLKIYEKIHGIYPHLDKDFIRSVYNMKDQLAGEYPAGLRIIILHRCNFRDVEKLRQFVEIALKHNYSINADEKKLIVDVFKEHVNSDGKIITSILEVANQSAYLHGTYEGYRVILENKGE